jgi:hypothetical protein
MPVWSTVTRTDPSVEVALPRTASVSRAAHSSACRRRIVFSWMCWALARPQPTGHHLGAAPREHVDPGAGVGVDQHGGVVMPSAQGEVIDPQHPRHSVIR